MKASAGTRGRFTALQAKHGLWRAWTWVVLGCECGELVAGFTTAAAIAELRRHQHQVATSKADRPGTPS